MSEESKRKDSALRDMVAIMDSYQLSHGYSLILAFELLDLIATNIAKGYPEETPFIVKSLEGAFGELVDRINGHNYAIGISNTAVYDRFMPLHQHSTGEDIANAGNF